MTLTTRCSGISLVLITSLASQALAQRRPAISLDATLGTSGGQTNGLFMARKTQGQSADVTAALRLRPGSTNGFVVAVNASIQGAGPQLTICIPRADGGCVPGFPSFNIFGVLAGWESRNSVLRVTGGAAYASGEDARGQGLRPDSTSECRFSDTWRSSARCEVHTYLTWTETGLAFSR